MGIPIPPPHVIILIGAIIVAIGGFMQYTQQQKFENEVRESSKQQMTSLTETLDGVQENLRTISGGDSFLYIDFHPYNSNTISPIIKHLKGEYPMHDISIRIVDVELFKTLISKGIPLDYDTYNKADVLNVDLGNLNPDGFKFLDQNRWDLPRDSEIKSYNIFIEARNGKFIQNTVFIKKDGKWNRAHRVYIPEKENPDKPKQILYYRVPSDFPIKLEDIPWGNAEGATRFK